MAWVWAGTDEDDKELEDQEGVAERCARVEKERAEPMSER